MKHLKRSAAVLLLAVFVLFTVLPVAAQDGVLVYSTFSNSGTRHVVCTTLEGTTADQYYIGAYTYDALSVLSDDALYDALASLMTDTHAKNASYNDCRDLSVRTDCEEENGRVNLIYTSFSATRDKFGGSGAVWNREHVWPKSLGGFNTTGAGSDLHHIRPSDARVNTVRNNDLYGNVKNGSAVYASGLVGTSFVGGTRGCGYFEPLDNAKGDVARICLYMYVRYGSDSRYNCSNITAVFSDIDTLLEWCELDPVDTWEMGRNEVVAAYQGNRNVFIDYPEYAWLVFGKEVPSDMTTPSGKASEASASCEHTATELRGEKAASCAEDGYTGDTHCAACGKKLTEGTGIQKTEDHSFGDWTTAGETQTRECTVCRKTESRATPACEHKNTELRGAAEPTCATEGSKGDLYCTDCDQKTADGEKIPATGEHDFFEGDVIVAPTETSTGLVEEICSVCGLSQGKELPALGTAEKPNDSTVIIVIAVVAVLLVGTAVTVVIVKKKK